MTQDPQLRHVAEWMARNQALRTVAQAKAVRRLRAALFVFVPVFFVFLVATSFTALTALFVPAAGGWALALASLTTLLGNALATAWTLVRRIVPGTVLDLVVARDLERRTRPLTRFALGAALSAIGYVLSYSLLVLRSDPGAGSGGTTSDDSGLLYSSVIGAVTAVLLSRGQLALARNRTAVVVAYREALGPT